MVVCGNINFESVNGFLSDFFHPAREDVNCEVGKPQELYFIPFHSLSGGFLEQVRAWPRVWGWGWISLLLRWWMDSGDNFAFLSFSFRFAEKRKDEGDLLSRDHAQVNWPKPISRQIQIQISIQILSNPKGWLAIAKLKPLVERYSCQPMRRLDTSNNLSVGPSCMWRTWNQCQVQKDEY